MSKWPVWLRIIAAGMSGLFLFCAYVQLNDPDWPLWVLPYLAASGLTLVSVAEGPGVGESTIAFLRTALMGFAMGLAAMSYPFLLDTSLNLWLETEPGREFTGSLLVAGWMVALLLAPPAHSDELADAPSSAKGKRVTRSKQSQQTATATAAQEANALQSQSATVWAIGVASVAAAAVVAYVLEVRQGDVDLPQHCSGMT